MVSTADELYKLSINEGADWGERYNAICNLEDQGLLKEAVVTALDPDIRHVAVRKIDDQELLAIIAKNDNDSNVRQAAIERLANWQRQILKEIASEDDSWHLRRKAVERLPAIYDEFFAGLLVKETDFRVRKVIMAKVKFVNLNEDNLFNLAVKAQDTEVRAAAARMIEDHNKLVQIASVLGDYNIIEEILERVSNQELIKYILNNAEYAHTKIKCLELINDEDFLMDVARKDPSLLVRGTAIYQINSIENLMLLKMLEEPELLQDVEERIAILESRSQSDSQT
ncbi:MAG: HEAT repeat domain-containing protein [Candidatus Heimdallarchaeota archaeon]|nr:HEAT repeat domain-containing protein [Candidatus Heimdallarchaeota archaeon]